MLQILICLASLLLLLTDWFTNLFLLPQLDGPFNSLNFLGYPARWIGSILNLIQLKISLIVGLFRVFSM